MWARARVGALLLVAAAVLCTTGGWEPARAEADGRWLDAPLLPWNVAGASVPPAPRFEIPVQPACAARERAAAGAEEAQLTSAGWRLIDAWPARRVTVSYGAGPVAVTLVMATAGYDGMCRPWGFNAFVFVDGRLAGTVSPMAMESRTDGVLFGQPAVFPSGRLEAAFTRYAPTDPLCCPSRGTTRVTYQLVRQAAGWVLLPETATTVAARLPATGGRGGL